MKARRSKNCSPTGRTAPAAALIVRYISEHRGHRVDGSLRWGAESIGAALTELGVKIALSTYYEQRGALRGWVTCATLADPAAPRPADLVQRKFAPAAPNRLWVADMTYVSTWSGWVYVSFVIGAYARRIIGWRTGTTMTAALVLDAIEHAIWTANIAVVT